MKVQKKDIFPTKKSLFQFARSNFFNKFLVRYFSYHRVTLSMSMSCLNSWVIICDQLLSGINSSACKYLSIHMHIHVTVVDWVAWAAFSKFTIQIDKWTFFILSLMPIQTNLVTNLISICCSELLWMCATFLQNWCGFYMELPLLQGSKLNVWPEWNGQCWCTISKTSL